MRLLLALSTKFFVEAAGVLVDDIIDLGVRDVTGRASAGASAALDCDAVPGEETVAGVAAGFGHGERAAVAADADDDLVRGHAGFGDLEKQESAKGPRGRGNPGAGRSPWLAPS